MKGTFINYLMRDMWNGSWGGGDSAQLRQMSIDNAQLALEQAKHELELEKLRIEALKKREETRLDIKNVKGINGRRLAGGWSITDALETNESYVFICEITMKVYDPYTFAVRDKTNTQAITLGRDMTSKGRYLLARTDNTFLELDKGSIKDLNSFVFYINELIYK